MTMFRILEPVKGNPTIQVRCRPVIGWEKEAAKAIRGNSHLRFEMRNECLRTVTNMSLTYLCEEGPFSLREPLYFGLTWSSGIEDDLVKVTHAFLDQTAEYWRLWVKHCAIPYLFQRETIRSALTLKLHCYEDTGAILAALTTSLPEELGGGRNWDYRYCWLRDAYFVLSALHNLGHFEEMEGFLKFILNLGEKHDQGWAPLRPVYRLDGSLPLPETEHFNWSGYGNSRPVRSENQAAEHIQNDVYGEMILTLSPIFFDERFHHLRTHDHEKLLGHLVKLCIQNISKEDAGLWEIRKERREHSFTNLMCWAGIDRIEKIRDKGFLNELEDDLKGAKQMAEAAIARAVRELSLRNGPMDDSFDAALLQLPILRYPDHELAAQTVRKVGDHLRLVNQRGGSAFLHRYSRSDDFGHPKAAFVICSFWLVQALVKIGKAEEASRIMQEAMSCANDLGLFSEHFLPVEQKQAGNFPQAYSHVGQINAAFALSPPWDQVL
ncbi:MAG TPA: glycoside hydrolase family 15 protein [Bdellovibrionota bacterium]|nr:glycoside hydrolase family 15 protein [Bdellovibrionota bacterium]